MVLWVLASDSELDGIGFPFDRAQLVFYERIRTAWDVVRGLTATDNAQDAIAPLRRALSLVANDRNLERVWAKLCEKVTLFDELRSAMRIALPDTDHGLNDDGTDCDIVTIKEKVTAFRERLATRITNMSAPDIVYVKMLKQIDKYWDKLFADPIAVKTNNGVIMIQPQRTNNILERFFRDLKRRNRKKSGTVSMSKTLRTMLTDTPLVRNLGNEHYMKAILNGAPDLQTRFAQIESAVVRKKLREDAVNPERIPATLKKVLRMPGLPSKIIRNLRCAVRQS